MLPVPMKGTSGRLRRQLSVATRRELIEVVAARYRASNRDEKKAILDQFVEVTGFHRKHAIRVLKRSLRPATGEPRLRARIYNEAVREALTIVWEAADRICGKRLRQVIPGLIDAMERHGHLNLDPAVRESLVSMSAATMDRLLTTVRTTAKQGRRRTMINTPLRKSIPVRTFGDWNDPSPGFFEMDMVVHCGKSTIGSYVHSLVLTDIASGWTEAGCKWSCPPYRDRNRACIAATSLRPLPEKRSFELGSGPENVQQKSGSGILDIGVESLGDGNRPDSVVFEGP